MAAKVKTSVSIDSSRIPRAYSCMRSIHACPLNTTGASPVARCVYMGHCDLVFIFACFLNLVLVAKSQRGTMTSLTNYTHICLLGAVLGFTDKMKARPHLPLLIPQAWTRDEGVRPCNSDLFFPFLGWVDWKGILRCLLFLRGPWEGTKPSAAVLRE